MSVQGGPKISSQGLLLYYDVSNRNTYPNEVTEDFIEDLSGDNFNASKSTYTIYNDTQIIFPSGETGSYPMALNVSSSAAGILEMGYESRTVEALIKISSGSEGGTGYGVFNHSAQGGSDGYGVQINVRRLRGEVYGPSGGRQGVYFDDGQSNYFDFDVWNHCVWIFDRENLRMIGYINGEYLGYTTFTEPGDVTYGYINAHIGTSHYNYYKGMYGELGFIKVYNKVLSEDEVKENYEMAQARMIPEMTTKDLIFYVDASKSESYPGTGTVWYDLSGNDIDGTLQNEAMATEDLGVSMRLNNTTDRIQFGHDLILEPTNLTICAWINLEDRGDRHILFTKWNGWSFEIHADGRPYLRLNGVSPTDLYSTEYLTWGQWYYITGTFDDVGNLGDIYINAINRGNATRSNSIVYNQSTFNIPYSGSAGYAKGKLGLVQIYNRALTANEVSNNYNSSKEIYINE